MAGYLTLVAQKSKASANLWFSEAQKITSAKEAPSVYSDWLFGAREPGLGKKIKIYKENQW